MEREKASFLCIFIILNFLLLPLKSHSQTPILKPSLIINLPPNATGPEALAFSPKSRNYNPNDITKIRFYTGASDGRVLQYVNGNFTDFATTAPNRSKELCDGKSQPLLEPICGRPLGLGFECRGKELYIADAYFGLMAVGPDGGKAKLLASSADGIAFRFLNAVDIDPISGDVYFTDASSRFQRSQFMAAVAARDSTGRLLRYNPKTKQVTVLLRNLGLPVGLAVSKYGDYLIFSSYINNSTIRFWIKGPKTGQSELFVKLSAPPDNIKRNSRGEFWVALNNGTASYGQKLGDVGRPRRGIVLKTLIVDVGNDPTTATISEVYEYSYDRFYVGSVTLPSVNVFDI